jgi:hypothetical protein
VATLASGQTSPLGSSASVQMSCVVAPEASGATVTQLAAWVDGTEVDAVADSVTHVALRNFVPVLLVGTYGHRIHVDVDQVTVRVIDPRTVTGR